MLTFALLRFLYNFKKGERYKVSNKPSLISVESFNITFRIVFITDCSNFFYIAGYESIQIPSGPGHDTLQLW